MAGENRSNVGIAGGEASSRLAGRTGGTLGMPGMHAVQISVSSLRFLAEETEFVSPVRSSAAK